MTRGLAASKPGYGGAGNLPETFHLVPQSIRTLSRFSQDSLRPVLNISPACQPLRSELRKGAKPAVPLADRANWQGGQRTSHLFAVPSGAAGMRVICSKPASTRPAKL